MPDFSFLDGERDDGTIRINTLTNRAKQRRGKPTPTIAQQLDGIQEGLGGCGRQLTGCGCLLVLLGLLLGLPFLLVL